MLKKLAAVAALPFLLILAVPAHAEPDESANYRVFLQAIAGDGIVMDPQQAILQGQSVCRSMEPPNGGSLWDAGTQINAMHVDWDMGRALHFADRSVQDICPNSDSVR